MIIDAQTEGTEREDVKEFEKIKMPTYIRIDFFEDRDF